MLKGIESKNVLVTGAAQGIGFAVAKRFAEEGASVFIVDRVENAQMAAFRPRLLFRVTDDDEAAGQDLDVIGVAATPLPAALPLFAGGLGALGLFGWRRKKSATLAA